MVIGVQGTIWFGYPEKGCCSRIGPFASLLEAKRALEKLELGGEVDRPRANDRDDFDDRPTARVQRPIGATGSVGGTNR
ncbi:MAG: hypothetical protein ACXVDD_12360 [Polyangia bacterium]